MDPGGDNRCDGAEHDRGCATSFAGGDCSFVAGEIAASQEIERVSLSRPAASERLATSISLAVGRRQRGAAGYETGGSRFRRSCHPDHVSHPNFVRVHLLQIWKPCWIEWRRRRLSGRVAAVKRGFSAGLWARFVVRRIRFPCHRVLPSYRNSDGSVQHVPSQWATLTLIASCGGSRFARSEAARLPGF